MFEMFQLSKNIKIFRIARGLSQTELANLLNISPQSVSKWECGTSVPDIENLCLLSDILNVSLDTLFHNTRKHFKIMIGISGNDFHTEFILFNEAGEILAKTFLEACNPNVIGLDQTLKILEQGIDEMLAVNSNVCGIHVGISGFGDDHYDRKMKTHLGKLYAHIDIQCKADILNAVAAVSPCKSYILALCGTGIGILVKKGEKLFRLNGWGHMLSKSGSGFDIGRDALYSALQDVEGFGEQTLITEIVKNRLGKDANQWISEIYRNDQAYYISSFSSAVFSAYAQGDKLAQQILDENARQLAFIINKTYENHQQQRVVFFGDLIVNNPVFRDMIISYLHTDIKVTIPDFPYSIGACMLCAEMCGVEMEPFKQKLLENYKQSN